MRDTPGGYSIRLKYLTMTDKRGTPGGLNRQKLGAHQGRLNITHVKRDTMDHHQSEKKGTPGGLHRKYVSIL